MKKYFVLLCAFAIIVFSCEQEEKNLDSDNSIELNKNVKFERLTNSAIGFEQDGKIKLAVSDEKIMQTFRKFAKRHSPDINPQSFKIINIDGEYYLRFYSENNVVSTVALFKDDNNQYSTRGTICESVACAQSGGCVPDGLYCTRCTPPDTLPTGPAGDCKRTTSSDEVDPNG